MKEHLNEGLRTKRVRGKDKVKDRYHRNGKLSSKHLRNVEMRQREKAKSHYHSNSAKNLQPIM